MKGLMSIILLLMIQSTFSISLDFFEFADTYECNDRFPHHSFCKAVVFKKWKKEEKELIRSYLNDFNVPVLENFFKKIKESGITKIHRVEHAASWKALIQERRVEFFRRNTKVLIWVNPVTKVMGITDSYFKGTKFIDPYVRMPRKKINILHEMVHLYDLATHHAVKNSNFNDVVGWEWEKEKNRFGIRNVDYDIVENQFREILNLVKQKKSKKAYALDRKLGIKYGFPTLYSMTSKAECFAEFLAYYVLDPNSKNYMNANIIEELDAILSK